MDLKRRSRCRTCRGRGFVWLKAESSHTTHYRRPGESDFAVVFTRERFRAPCFCKTGDAWIEARRRGEELEDDSSAPRR